MARCTICAHPKRKAIDRALALRQQTYAKIADAFGVSIYALERHLRNHLKAEQRKVVYAEAKQEQDALKQDEAAAIVRLDSFNVMSSLTRLSQRCEKILDRAEDDGEDGLALSAIRELRHQIGLAAKLIEHLNADQPEIIIADHPQWLAIRDVLWRVFDRHPEARADFVATVKALGHAGARLAG